MNEQELIDLIFRFTKEVNALEETYYPILKQASDVATVFREFASEQKDIYDCYLTNRQRTYTHVIGCPAKFTGVDRHCSVTIEYKSDKKAEVACCTGSDMCVDYMFIMVQKNNLWKINSFKTRYHSANRDIEYTWQNNSF